MNMWKALCAKDMCQLGEPLVFPKSHWHCAMIVSQKPFDGSILIACSLGIVMQCVTVCNYQSP